MAALSLVAASMAMTMAATQAGSVAPDSRQEVCDNLSTGHQPGDGDNSFTVTAPSGMLIVRTCVKAGSDQSVPEGAVQYADYAPGVSSVTIYGPGGKDISHWTAQFAAAPVFTGEATVSGSEQICTVADETVTVSFTSGLVTRTSTDSQEAADAAAQEAAELAAAADRASQLEAYPDYTPGACTPTTPPTTPPAAPPTAPPAAPETVAPVLPATVEESAVPEQVAVPLPATVEEVEQPEVVSVPMPATAKVPTSVPAGDGSSASLVPAAVALLLVSLIGLSAATMALALRRQE